MKAVETKEMAYHYASLITQHLQKSHEKYSPLKAEESNRDEAFGEGYWDGRLQIREKGI